MYLVCKTCGKIFGKGKRSHREALEYYNHSFTCGKDGYTLCSACEKFPAQLCEKCNKRYTCWSERQEEPIKVTWSVEVHAG